MKKENRAFRKMSLKNRLILAFILISIIPITMIIWFSYYNSSNIIRRNAEEMTRNNLNQTKVSLDVWVASYEDILFQIYTNDEIVEMIDTINKNDADLFVTRGQLRRTLRGLFYTKEHIKSITVITENGDVVFYDLLTGSTTKNAWLDELKLTRQELYNMISEDNQTHVITTERAGVFANETYYLFHLGHRVIDYKNINRRLGVVIISIDETMLKEICGDGNDSNELTFLVDNQGILMSYPNKELLGKQIIEWTDVREEREEDYLEFVKEQNIFEGKHIFVTSVYDEKFGCDIVRISDRSEMMSMLSRQQNIMLLIMCFSMVLLITIIIILTYRLTASLHKLVGLMKRAEKGELSVRVKMDESMLPEVETIASQFNRMLDKVEISMDREKEAIEKQKNAEIEALEAQINPHFLYNTLDTINWMAIDKDEYEISNSITALATILRYGIDKSNSVVTVGRECDWLRQYVFLQQTRLKNQFECGIHVSPKVTNWKIHKLLLQPFVENAILHGFEGRTGTLCLEVSIVPEGDQLSIEIYDNGKGIPKEILDKMNRGQFPKSNEKNHIGMENAISRISMYYPGEAKVWLESESGIFTKVHITIPKRVE
jgi:two-component system sensor histidine kinase YesM